LPKSVFDDLQAQLKANRAPFYHDVPAGPFYGYNCPKPSAIEKETDLFVGPLGICPIENKSVTCALRTLHPYR
jgi:hypothetical protein